MTILKAGLTGGIASGKSTVAAMLGELGAGLVDVDALARGVLEPGSPLLPQVLQAFGPVVAAPGGGLDRAALRKIIFEDQSQRERLNALVHPEVGRRGAARVGAPGPGRDTAGGGRRALVVRIRTGRALPLHHPGLGQQTDANKPPD